MVKKEIYNNLIHEINEIVSEAKKLEVAHENIEPIKTQLLNGLKKHRDIFKHAARKAKRLSEWDKYTIAFFGETNAGKSTIIESLRILGKEKGKLKEYEEIERIKLDIENSSLEIVRDKEIEATSINEKEILEQNLQKKNLLYQEINNEIDSNTDQLNKGKEYIENFEEELKITKEKQKDCERKQYVLEQKKKSIIKEILKEEHRLLKKEQSLVFNLKSWFGSLIGKRLVVNDKYLLELKENDFGIQQTLNELQAVLEDLSIEKEQFNQSLLKIKKQIGDSSFALDTLQKNQKVVIQEIAELEQETSDITTLIDRCQMKIINSETLIKENKNRLGTIGDGLIIGTGKQDFTVDVNSYELEYNSQPVVLIDVPGIEGDEEKYTNMIKDAVSKAHAVFYVHASNKKPEEKTLEKIKTYLQDQTEVYSISNVLGKADTYEVEEDRKQLTVTHKDLNKTVELTKSTLNQVLKSKYKGHMNVQGLLAFAGVSKYITPQRKSLVRNRASLLNHFDNVEMMKAFSNINSIETLIVEQQPFTFKKIEVANLQTIIGVTSRFIEALNGFQGKVISDEIVKQIEREINNYQNEVEVDLIGLKSSFGNISSRLTNQFYNQLQLFLHHIIDKEYDKTLGLFPEVNTNVKHLLSRIKTKGKDKEALEEFANFFVEQLLNKIQSEFRNSIKSKLEEFYENLQNKKKKISSRLRIINDQSNGGEVLGALNINFDSITAGFNFGNFLMKEGLDLALTIGGFASSGFAIGSFFPVIGNILGAILGAIIGAIIFGAKKIFGGESQEAKKKREIEPELVKIRKEIAAYFDDLYNQVFLQVKENVSEEKKVLTQCQSGLRKLHCMLKNKINDIAALADGLNKEKVSIEDTYINTRLN